MKKNLTAFMMVVMMMLFVLPMSAQTKVGYALWEGTNKTLTFYGEESVPSSGYALNTGIKDPQWKSVASGTCTKVVFDESFKDVRPTTCFFWFYEFQQLQSIEGIAYLNTEKVTSMGGMFNGCSALASLDLSSFNTCNVTDMSYMFNGCSKLESIYVSDNFSTNSVTSSTDMFKDCNNLRGAVIYDASIIDSTMANYTAGYFKTYYKLGEAKMDLCGETLTVDNLDLSGDKDFVAHAPFTATTVSYSRDLSSSTSTWFSLCLPFAFTPSNFTAYELNSATGDVVELKQLTGEIAAGTPVFFKFNDSDKTINISASDATIEKSPVAGTSVTGTDNCTYQLCGTYQEKIFSKEADDNAFILHKNKLMNPAKMLENANVTKVSVKPFRAYMTCTLDIQQSGARAFSIGFGEDEAEATVIDQLNNIATDDAEYYDINGRRIDGPAKGLNIVRRGNKTMKLIIK
ncbi:MAG: BspA family leucine-rich repeat surface protein [Muribaculaceae bacterium]